MIYGRSPDEIRTDYIIQALDTLQRWIDHKLFKQELIDKCMNRLLEIEEQWKKPDRGAYFTPTPNAEMFQITAAAHEETRHYALRNLYFDIEYYNKAYYGN